MKLVQNNMNNVHWTVGIQRSETILVTSHINLWLMKCHGSD